MIYGAGRVTIVCLFVWIMMIMIMISMKTRVMMRVIIAMIL